MKHRTKHFSNILYILKIIMKSSPGRLPLTLLAVVLSVGTNFLFNVYLVRLVVNAMQTQTPLQDVLWYIVGVGVLLVLHSIFTNYYNEIFIPRSNRILYQNIQKRVYDKAREVDLACFDDSAFYDQYTKAINETANITQRVLTSLANWLTNILTIFSASLVIFLIDPIFILFAIVPVIYTLILGPKLNKLNYERHMEMVEKERKRDYIKRTFYLSDYAKEMRLTNISNVLFGRFFEVIDDLKETIHRHGKKISVIDYFSIVIQYVFLYIGSIVYSTYRTVVLKNMLFGDCVIIVNNIVSTATAIKGVVSGYTDLHANSLAIQNIKDYLEYEPMIASKADAASVPDDTPTITLNHVDFSYKHTDRKVLDDICMTIHPGEKIALVGHNGAGKTTLVRLLLRFYDPVTGTVELNGKDIKEYRLDEYRELYGTVFQHYKVFSMSILENILLHDNITPEEAEAAIEGMKNSGIYEKVKTLPKMEHSVLTKEFDPDGEILSGGENQKIAISRVYAKPCKIAILDEPSSALDPIAESRMYEAMMKACHDKTVIYISHRLSSATLADHIYLLENGRIIEHGRHDALLALNGKYADMWEKQAQQYRKGETA